MATMVVFKSPNGATTEKAVRGTVTEITRKITVADKAKARFVVVVDDETGKEFTVATNGVQSVREA